QSQHQAEASARDHARFVTDSVLGPALVPGDVVRPFHLPDARYRAIRRIVEARILHATFPVVRVKVWRRDGTVLFSESRDLVGRRFEVDDDLEAAFRGEVEADVTDLSKPENVAERGLASKLFETYVPLHV